MANVKKIKFKKNTIVLYIVFILIILFSVGGTLAYFTSAISPKGTVTVGENIDFLYCESDGSTVASSNYVSSGVYEFSNLTFSQSKLLNLYVKQVNGVNAKIRTFIAVSIEDDEGNLQNLTPSGESIVSITMVNSANWIADENISSQASSVGAYKRYYQSSGENIQVSPDDIIGILGSVSINNNPYTTGYKLRIVITTELLQYDNAEWN